MIVQSAPLTLKQRNQVNRECLYAWYPEVVSEASAPTGPRDIYIHKGLDRDLLQENPAIYRFTNTCNDNNNYNSNNNDDVLQRYQQSMAPSERIYQSTETLDEALKTPWALHYEVQHRAATPNFSSNSSAVSTSEDLPRRLKSAPLVRSLPPTSVLTIPEPRFVTPIISLPTNQPVQTPLASKARARASSAKARLNTTFPLSNELSTEDYRERKREIRSAQTNRPKDEQNSLIDQNQNSTIQVYDDIIQLQQQPPSTPPLIYSNTTSEPPSTPIPRQRLRNTSEITTIPLNPHYVHRPGIISVRNSDKKAVVQENYTSKKLSRHYRRHPHSHPRQLPSRGKQNKPLLALTPIPQPPKIPFELEGVNLIYDPSLSVDDSSSNMTRYLIENSLYLIKDQRYNVLENIDPTALEKYNQTINLPQRPKYYQTIPIEKFQIPKPAKDVHYNASETYFYNTIPKHVHRYVIDPNFISENLNINRMSLSKRPPTATIHHDFRHQKPPSPMVNA